MEYATLGFVKRYNLNDKATLLAILLSRPGQRPEHIPPCFFDGEKIPDVATWITINGRVVIDPDDGYAERDLATVLVEAREVAMDMAVDIARHVPDAQAYARAVTRAVETRTPENGTPEDGTPEDGTPEDGTPDDEIQDDEIPDDDDIYYLLDRFPDHIEFD